MKRALVFCTVLVLAFSMSISAFAAGGFISSPSNNPAPKVEEVVAEGVPDGVEFVLEVTPYKDAENLDPVVEAELKQAYADIKAATDLTALVSELGDVAKNQNVDVKNLAVSDLVDISANTDEHGAVRIKLNSNQLQNFVALLHKHNNEWTVVESAKIVNGALTFSVNDFSPFAIVVEKESTSPETGDASIYIWAILALASAAAATVCFVKYRKINA